MKANDQILVYPYIYRIFFTFLLISIVGITLWSFLFSQYRIDFYGEIPVFPLVIGISLVFVCYKLLRYLLYIYRWKAILAAEGIVIKDPWRGQLSFSWDTDVIVLGNFNLELIKGRYGPAATASDEKYAVYKISNWVMGQPAIADSNLAFLGQKSFKNLKLSSKEFAAALESSREQYSDFFKINRWNLVFLAYWFCQIIAIMLIAYIFFLDIFYFNTGVVVFFCVAVTIQLVMVLQYWNRFPPGALKRLFLNVGISIIGFAYLMFDNVHSMDELFFVKWGAVLGFVMTLFIRVFIQLYRKFVAKHLKIIFYSILFIFLSLYSIAFLKVGNMLNRGKVKGWEQGTVYNPQIIILPGMDPHKMVFDNPQWGARNMLVPLVRSVSEARVEVKVFEGRLGIPWFYKNYAKDDVDNVRLIK
ncbi:hypothetical protein [Sphingobacterium prati]|uniref:hypothetical protein n=1 Tax=Sphingobacterium prati TaxID=2737006 RepID=UPI001551FB06|nr:hypothetical protein [Sphingobacterium prati]NPE47814.1 hypothetical protein [Sphingobacterium prati]